jgi:hypothetical protein
MKTLKELVEEAEREAEREIRALRESVTLKQHKRRKKKNGTNNRT